MAETKKLFPVVDVPKIVTVIPAAERKYKPSYYFDYEIGDFRRDGANRITMCNGKEAYLQWCIKIVMTERLACLSYGFDIGTELYDAMKQPDRKAVESALERTITEALMVDPRTEYVRGFSFKYESDQLWCAFTVKGKAWEEQQLRVSIQI